MHSFFVSQRSLSFSHPTENTMPRGVQAKRRSGPIPKIDIPKHSVLLAAYIKSFKDSGDPHWASTALEVKEYACREKDSHLTLNAA